MTAPIRFRPDGILEVPDGDGRVRRLGPDAEGYADALAAWQEDFRRDVHPDPITARAADEPERKRRG